MSGIYIPGMEMPQSCHECVAGYGGCYYVAPPEADGICPDHDRPDWCPLVPVPEPHGRLIDASAFVQSIRDVIHYDASRGREYISAEDLQEALTNAPTIIPAEEGET